MATTSAIDVVMPQMGVSVSEGTITKWLKQEGEHDRGRRAAARDLDRQGRHRGAEPRRGRRPADPRPGGRDGRRRHEARGDRAARRGRGGACGRARARARRRRARAGAGAASPRPSAASSRAAEPEPEPVAAEPEPVAPGTDGTGEKTFVSPVVARIAAEHGVDVAQVAGTGRGGRVTKKDILAFVESGPPAAAPLNPRRLPSRRSGRARLPPRRPRLRPRLRLRRRPQPTAPPAPPARRRLPPQPAVVAEAGEEIVEPMTAMRRGIAEHMRRSLDTSAHVTTVFEVDMSKVVAIRKRLKPEYQESYGVNPTYLAFIARATIEAIRNWPWVNAELRGEQIVDEEVRQPRLRRRARGRQGPDRSGDQERRGAEPARHRPRDRRHRRARAQQEADARTTSRAARSRSRTPAAGARSSARRSSASRRWRSSTSRRSSSGPVVVQDERGKDVIAIRPMMNLCLSYDHRLVDGAYAAQFMRELRESLESWDEGATTEPRRGGTL